MNTGLGHDRRHANACMGLLLSWHGCSGLSLPYGGLIGGNDLPFRMPVDCLDNGLKRPTGKRLLNRVNVSNGKLPASGRNRPVAEIASDEDSGCIEPGILKTAVGIECCEISIGCVTYVGANLFARKWLNMRINSHLQPGQLRFPGTSLNHESVPSRSGYQRKFTDDARLLLLKSLTRELQRPAVLSNCPHHVVRRAGRYLCFDFDGYRHI